MKLNVFAIVTCLLLFLGSCSVPKNVTYFQGIDNLTAEQKEMMTQNYSSKICPDDRLSITVTAWDPTVVTPFNPPVYAYAKEGDEKVQPAEQLQTYLVDKEGILSSRSSARYTSQGSRNKKLMRHCGKKLRTM